MPALFALGRVVATPGALRALSLAGEPGRSYLARHASGDWGDLCEEDWRTNDEAVRGRARIFSAYHLGDGTKIWIITEADRSSTCLLLPEEY